MNTRNIRFRSNRMRDVLEQMHAELDAAYGAAEVSVFAEMLCEAFLGWDRVQLLLNKDRTIDQSDLLRFHWAVEDLLHWRPIQHIIGYVDFCGCRIAMCPDVLIPRPETEEMVRQLAERMAAWKGRERRVIDLCTGSGCIAIALKYCEPGAVVEAVDVSEAALRVARSNAAACDTEVAFRYADVLAESFGQGLTEYDLIVSNPPYVRQSERSDMAANVLQYEPELALFVADDDPLLFYRAIAAFAKHHLAPEGLLAVEINEVLSEPTCALLNEHGLHTQLHHDFRDKPRWIEAKRKLD